MSSVQTNVIITLLYEDDSTRNYVFEDVAAADLLNIRDKINAINENANNEYQNFYKTFISDDGEPVSKIISAKIVSLEEEVIYNG